jgi:hypothetical protein
MKKLDLLSDWDPYVQEIGSDFRKNKPTSDNCPRDDAQKAPLSWR